MSREHASARPGVAVVVLNYRNHADTVECLDSLLAATYPGLDLIVVDNDSGNDSLARVAEALRARGQAYTLLGEAGIDGCAAGPEPVLLVQAAVNRGYAAGNNLGIRCALARGADYVLILNNDTLVEPGFLEPLVAYTDAHADVMAAGPKLVQPDGRIDRSCARRRPSMLFYILGVGAAGMLWPGNRWRKRHLYEGEYAFDVPRSVDLLSGACMLIKRSLFDAIGLLDETTFLYFEELILHEKIRVLGGRQVIVPASVVVHKGGMATGAVDPALLRETGRDSLRYYLRRYRHCSRLTTWAVLASLRVPIWIRTALNRLSGTRTKD